MGILPKMFTCLCEPAFCLLPACNPSCAYQIERSGCATRRIAEGEIGSGISALYTENAICSTWSRTALLLVNCKSFSSSDSEVCRTYAVSNGNRQGSSRQKTRFLSSRDTCNCNLHSNHERRFSISSTVATPLFYTPRIRNSSFRPGVELH